MITHASLKNLVPAKTITLSGFVIHPCFGFDYYAVFVLPRPDGSVVSVSDSKPSGCEFDTRLRRTFFPEYFRFSLLLKHVRTVVVGFGKKMCLCWCKKAWKHMCVTDRHGLSLPFNPFPNKPWFLRVCKTSLLKTLWEKEKLLVTSNFSFSHSVSTHFHQVQNSRLQTISVWKSLKFVVWKRVKVALNPNTTNQQHLFYGKGLRYA